MRSATILLLLALSPAASAGQADLFQQTDSLDNKADHDSEDRAVEKGFEAFANLAALNIGGAISNGKQAYGAYENSKEFERLSREAERRKQRMNSGGKVEARPLRERRHILGTMDRSRLYKGAVGDAAAKAEQAFGWSREQMFDIAVRWEAQVLSKVEDGSTVTSAAFGDSVEDARRLIPYVPNPKTRSTLEKVSAIVTPQFAAFTLDKIFGEHAEGKGKVTDPSPSSPASGPALVAPSTPAPAPAELRPQGTPQEQLANENLERAIEVADAPAAARLSREVLDASGRAIVFTPPDTAGGLKLLETYFPPERTLFQMVRTQTEKFDRERHGLPAPRGLVLSSGK